MKKIAVPTENGRVAQHFGHCPEFTLFEVDAESIIKKEIVENPGHVPGYLPKFLNELKVDCILASGMGNKAKELFDANGIEVVIGVEGSAEEAVKQFLAGNIETKGNFCDH